MTKKKLLHVGCGGEYILGRYGFDPEIWQEIRFDIDAECKPDIVGDMRDLSAFADNSVDAIFSSHNIEHLYPHDVLTALKEFCRVLKPEGFLLLSCPDIQPVCQAVAEDKLTVPLYYTKAGLPVAPLDILYGSRIFMANGKMYMAHHCAFTSKSLRGTLLDCGFQSEIAFADKGAYALYAVATKPQVDEQVLKDIFIKHWLANQQNTQES